MPKLTWTTLLIEDQLAPSTPAAPAKSVLMLFLQANLSSLPALFVESTPFPKHPLPHVFTFLPSLRCFLNRHLFRSTPSTLKTALFRSRVLPLNCIDDKLMCVTPVDVTCPSNCSEFFTTSDLALPTHHFDKFVKPAKIPTICVRPSGTSRANSRKRKVLSLLWSACRRTSMCQDKC